jgi:hypothetical protein
MEWVVVGTFLLVVLEVLFWVFVAKVAWKRWGKNDS